MNKSNYLKKNLKTNLKNQKFYYKQQLNNYGIKNLMLFSENWNKQIKQKKMREIWRFKKNVNYFKKEKEEKRCLWKREFNKEFKIKKRIRYN